ncbi:putative membrane-anchored protein [Rhizobium mongolense]
MARRDRWRKAAFSNGHRIHGRSVASPDGKHGIGTYGNGRLKWEIHAEFVTLTYAESASPENARPVPDAFNELCASCGGEPELTRFEGPRVDFVASEVGGGDAVVH